MKKRLWITTTLAATCLVGTSAPALAGEGHDHRGGTAVAERHEQRVDDGTRGEHRDGGRDHDGTRGERWDRDGRGDGWRDCPDKGDAPAEDPAAVPEQPAAEQPVAEEPVVEEPAAPVAEPAAPVEQPVSATDAAEVTILDRTNALRAGDGVAGLTRSAELDAVAAAWAKHLATSGEFRHNPDVAAQVPAGWTAVGENIALNSTDPAAFATQWENSPSHRANLVNAGYTQIGIAVVEHEGVYYGVQVFAGY